MYAPRVYQVCCVLGPPFMLGINEDSRASAENYTPFGLSMQSQGTLDEACNYFNKSLRELKGYKYERLVQPS